MVDVTFPGEGVRGEHSVVVLRVVVHGFCELGPVPESVLVRPLFFSVVYPVQETEGVFCHTVLCLGHYVAHIPDPADKLRPFFFGEPCLIMSAHTPVTCGRVVCGS